MKKIFQIIIILFAISFVIKAQEIANGELQIKVKNNTYSDNVEIEIDLTSALCWEADIYYPNTHDLTTSYQGGSKFTSNPWTETLDFYACWNKPIGSGIYFGLGRYQVIAKVEDEIKDQFYIDYRTASLPENFNLSGNGDVVVDFDVSDQIFYYTGTQNPYPTSVTIWGLKNWINYENEELEPLPPENLYYVNYNNHPKLIWSHSSNTEDFVTHYEVHRIFSGGSWTNIATQVYNLLWYFDEAVNINTLATWVSYKIRSKNGNRTSDEFSNTITISAYQDFGKDSDGQNSNENNNFVYRLEQNYPNPFNPVTTINFSLKENSFVTLKVYDIIGREITRLVNGFMNKGNHQIHFDGSDLESGIYIYEINTDDFKDFKKFMLIK